MRSDMISPAIHRTHFRFKHLPRTVQKSSGVVGSLLPVSLAFSNFENAPFSAANCADRDGCRVERIMQKVYYRLQSNIFFQAQAVGRMHGCRVPLKQIV